MVSGQHTVPTGVTTEGRIRATVDAVSDCAAASPTGITTVSAASVTATSTTTRPVRSVGSVPATVDSRRTHMRRSTILSSGTCWMLDLLSAVSKMNTRTLLFNNVGSRYTFLS